MTTSYRQIISAARAGRIVAIVIAALVLVACVPLGGRAPEHCSYDLDVGTCEMLVYRSVGTIGLAHLRWGGTHTFTGTPGVPASP